MGTDRIARVNEQLRREVGANLFRIIHEADVDLSTITITKVEASRDLRYAKVYVSIRGTEDDQEQMMQLLGHHRHDFQALINKDLVLKYTPQISFHLDNSISKGHHVLDILSEIAPVEPTDIDPDAEPQDPD